MSFTRTQSGIANYKLFFDVDLVVYIEGKAQGFCSDGEITSDELFYKSLLSMILPAKRVKIKCVGNSDSVLAHVKKLIEIEPISGFGIIDRDSVGILYSFINISEKLVITKGYSWENDLWSEYTILKSAGRLNIGENLGKQITLAVKRSMRRLSLLCRLDFACRIHGSALFKKNGKGSGLGFTGKKYFAVSLNEIRRLIMKYKKSIACNCNTSKRILDETKTILPDIVVQGHLKNSLVCNVIASSYHSVYKNSNVAHATILNIALSLFSENQHDCLGEDTYNYYENKIREIIIG